MKGKFPSVDLICPATFPGNILPVTWGLFQKYICLNIHRMCSLKNNEQFKTILKQYLSILFQIQCASRGYHSLPFTLVCSAPGDDLYGLHWGIPSPSACWWALSMAGIARDGAPAHTHTTPVNSQEMFSQAHQGGRLGGGLTQRALVHPKTPGMLLIKSDLGISFPVSSPESPLKDPDGWTPLLLHCLGLEIISCSCSFRAQFSTVANLRRMHSPL